MLFSNNYCCEAIRSAILATAWLLCSVHHAFVVADVVETCCVVVKWSASSTLVWSAGDAAPALHKDIAVTIGYTLGCHIPDDNLYHSDNCIVSAVIVWIQKSKNAEPKMPVWRPKFILFSPIVPNWFQPWWKSVQNFAVIEYRER